MDFKEPDAIELRFVLQRNRFTARCESRGIVLGPFIDRQLAEDAIVAALRTVLGVDRNGLPCLVFLATEYA